MIAHIHARYLENVHEYTEISCISIRTLYLMVLFLSVTWEPWVNSLADLMRVLTCGLLHANLSPATQIAGFKVIVDFSGFTLKHVPHVSPTYLWLFAEALQVSKDY